MANGLISSGAAVQPAFKALPVVISSGSVSGLPGLKLARSNVAAAAARPNGAGQSADEVIAKKQVVLTTDDLKKISQQMQQKVASMSPELRFSVDQDSGRTVIKVTDRSTDKLVRQIPTDEALQISKDMALFQKGLLLNQKV
ncbi:MAG: flagellar protein FlaG [Comamonadaceae bacterium]|nr:flagellar protein FlaG [Comamonadaceae bacterium]